MPMILNSQSSLPTDFSVGLHLARLSESQGGWREFFYPQIKEGENVREGACAIKDPLVLSNTALLLENAKSWLGALGCKRRDEAGRWIVDESMASPLLGGLADNLFTMIRAGFPNHPINDMYSVQATTKRIATFVFLDFVAGVTKGEVTAGSRIFDARLGKRDINPDYSSELIRNEAQGVADGTDTITGQLNWHDGLGIRPGTAQIRAVISTTETVFADNGNGGWDNSGVTGAIDYKTGIFSIVLNSGTFDNGTAVRATYRYNSETSRQAATIEPQISYSMRETVRRAYIMRRSASARFDLMQELGEDLDALQLKATTENLYYEIFRELNGMCWDAAETNTTLTFNRPNPAGYSRREHYEDLSTVIEEAISRIQRRNPKVQPTWMWADARAMEVLRTLPSTMFQQAPPPANPEGVYFAGTYQGRLRVMYDTMGDLLPNASAHGNIMLGPKGTFPNNVGVQFMPYHMLYTTDPLEDGGFNREQGLAARYAAEMIHPEVYESVKFTNVTGP